MGIINTQAAENARKVRTGKDCCLLNGKGKLLATMETYQSKMSVNNTGFQPLGSVQEYDVNTGYKLSLNFTEIVVEDSEFIIDLMNYQDTGILPEWNCQGCITGRNGSVERMVYPNCVPAGDIDLQNVTVGDTIKRAWSLTVNGKAKLQGKLKA